MDVPEELTVQAGRAAYNAFAHWTAIERERAKDLLLLERIDVLTARGEARMRSLRGELEEITDRVRRRLPRWAEALCGATRGMPFDWQGSSTALTVSVGVVALKNANGEPGDAIQDAEQALAVLRRNQREVRRTVEGEEHRHGDSDRGGGDHPQ